MRRVHRFLFAENFPAPVLPGGPPGHPMRGTGRGTGPGARLYDLESAWHTGARRGVADPVHTGNHTLATPYCLYV